MAEARQRATGPSRQSDREDWGTLIPTMPRIGRQPEHHPTARSSGRAAYRSLPTRHPPTLSRSPAMANDETKDILGNLKRSIASSLSAEKGAATKRRKAS